MKRLFTLIVAALACCATAVPVFGAEVVCTTTIVGDVVSQIARGDVQVVVLFPPDTDPHAFEPRPQDVVTLQQADLVFINGLDLEAGLSPILKSIQTPIVSLSDGIQGLMPMTNTTSQDSVTYDPHVWFDPTLVMEWVSEIADQLSQLVPSAETAIRDRAATYQQDLVDLDTWIQDTISTVPADRRKLVTDHRALGYFAQRYGFEQVGALIPGYSSLAEPSARDLANLVTVIQDLSVPAVFVGDTVNPTLAEQVTADTHTKLVFLYTGALSKPDGAAATYLDFMRYDTNAIVGALGEGS